jgi:glutathione S-transferase
VQLYLHHRASPPVRKVRAVALQLGLRLDEIEVDHAARAHQAPAYLALNPNAKFPTLVDGDFVLWESNAICQYLAAQRPAAGLLPADERGRADVHRWQSWELSHLTPAGAKLIALSKRPDATAQAAAVADFRRWAAVLESHLGGRAFLVGERLTVADFSVAAILMYREVMPLDGLPELGRWFGSVAEQPGWRASEPTEM